eukprot:CAMPEP_0172682058 /NCGR_PEP_ID=MMETSP1074-20121228/17897_1 /TAXON_ID=2916 /ORGANISM="Ceratium fusus, Strain PA161109" /LENGTH=73 /DNA_ID=CAMNT_0013500677 /DNA_START=366 /DNA_END=587 /DNA_ORIENTATION=-
MPFVLRPRTQLCQVKAVLYDAARVAVRISATASLEVTLQWSPVESALHVARVCPTPMHLYVANVIAFLAEGLH